MLTEATLQQAALKFNSTNLSASDGKYIYQNFREKFVLEGAVTTIWNITSEAYQNYKDRLFALTFSQRFLTVHYVLTAKERKAWVEKEEAAKKGISSTDYFQLFWFVADFGFLRF